MKTKLILLLCALATFAALNADTPRSDVFYYWHYYDGIPALSLYRHLTDEAADMLHRRSERLASFTTAEQWQQHAATHKANLAKLVGEFPERTPLNPVITGKLKGDGFTVEKLYFESMPGYYVNATMFLPIKRKGKLPAILYCCGHDLESYRNVMYQGVIINLVQKGFAVLAFEPIGQGERRQTDINPCTREHSRVAAQTFLMGEALAKYIIWDGIRAIDYLCSRKEIDPKRIGVHGRSGGGTQSAFLAAIDDRVVAAAPDNYITNFEMLLKSAGAQDGEQNFVHGIELGFDQADLITMRAIPTLITATYHDIFSPEGTFCAIDELKRAYAALGKADYLHFNIDYGFHHTTKHNREACYAFFSKYLKNPCDTTDLTVTPFPKEQLNVLPSGTVFSQLGGKKLFDITAEQGAKVIAEQQTRKNADYSAFLASLPATVRDIIGYKSHAEGVKPIFTTASPADGYVAERYLVPGCGNYFVPVIRLHPDCSADKAVLYLCDGGKAEAIADSLTASLLAEGNDVFIVDISGMGELAPGNIPGGDSVVDGNEFNLWFLGVLTNHSLTGIRAKEIDNTVRFIRSISKNSPISAVARGYVSVDMLHATVAGHLPLSSLRLIDAPQSWQTILLNSNYDARLVMSAPACAMRHYDIPDLVNCVATTVPTLTQ